MMSVNTFDRNRLFVVAFILLVLFTLLGIWVGTPKPAEGNTFAQTLASFASDTKTRIILGGILIDVITGVAAALHLRVFDLQRLAQFYATNVIPYVLGYMLVWCLVLFGLDTLFSPSITEGLAALGFSAVTSTLTASIADNIQKLRTPAP